MCQSDLSLVVLQSDVYAIKMHDSKQNKGASHSELTLHRLSLISLIPSRPQRQQWQEMLLLDVHEGLASNAGFYVGRICITNVHHWNVTWYFVTRTCEV
jgi:hypothetical protein